MPFVRIDVTGPKSPEYKRALLTGTRGALTGVFGVPDSRVTVRVIETPAADIDTAPGRTERLTMVDVLMFEGRTAELKSEMTADLRERLAKDPGIEPSEVVVNFRDAGPIDLDVFAG